MKTIYKQKLEITEVQTILVGLSSEVLSLQIQDGDPTIWYSRDTEDREIPIKIMTVGTGNQINFDTYSKNIYAGTYILGDFVGHVYVEKI